MGFVGGDVCDFRVVAQVAVVAPGCPAQAGDAQDAQAPRRAERRLIRRLASLPGWFSAGTVLVGWGWVRFWSWFFIPTSMVGQPMTEACLTYD
ncbi:hypothetical protein [Rothia nasimurium]|uniref:hypothetical protein n=1 Tax=Rothia nasimurium TaxID=85336 RepID=UPI001F42E58B|nr:hypothetical protein [Rothia nasimurium]